MKSRIALAASGAAAVIFGVFFLIWKTPLPRVPQAQRCAEMLSRRDEGNIEIPENATKEDIRQILGDPQNVDQDARVWVWLLDWQNYERSGFPRDWCSMATLDHSDGLWIGFDEHGRIKTPLWSFSAADPVHDAWQ
ncbi:hypothetical protein EV701_104264 [Chthoniobacter flavus]|uniref:hypothetical protein n=1 Tax=Chthoniobacter flavus TaxID=191863 RepID=UPI00104A530D|nr:hypothetical protein [Chthoniobacter flavus]TCO93560.1 hypothetical protein EV701_104264 [Chthoniobacter flavus]